MFIETNSIQGFIIDLDGFVLKDGTKLLPKRNFKKYLSEVSKYPISFVSRLLSEEEAISFIKAETGNSHQVFTPKPEKMESIMFRGPILRAKKSMGLPSNGIVFISADPENISEAIASRLGNILVGKEDFNKIEKEETFKHCPDFNIKGSDDLKAVISGEIMGYAAEVETTPSDYFKKLYPQLPSKRFVMGLTLDRRPEEGYPEISVRLLGRYFETKDPRHIKHALSRRILHSKNNPQSQAVRFGRIFGNWISYIEEKEQVDYITVIPSQPGQVDRLGIFLKELDGNLKKRARVDIIECVQAYPKQKTASRHADRKTNVQGKFKVNNIKDIKDKTIVLLDDVFTTGATVFENAKILFDAGAKKIIPLCLSFHVFPSSTGMPEEVLKCSKCKEILQGRCNSKDGDVFFGCSHYFSSPKCNGTMTHTEGVRELNQKTELDINKIEKGIPDDIPF